MSARELAVAALASALLVASCGDGDGDEAAGAGGATPRLELVAVEAPTPVLPGSTLRVTARGVEGDVDGLALELEGGRAPARLGSPEREPEGAALLFTLSPEAASAVGEGDWTLAARLIDAGGRRSTSLELPLTVARTITPRVGELPEGDVHYNDEVLLRGGGFIAPGEGALTAHFRGRFLPDDGGADRTVDVSAPATPAERFARDRALVRLPPAIGGLAPGVLDGSLELVSVPSGGARASTGALPLRLRFLPPELFAVAPEAASLEQWIELTGAGFAGAPDEATLIGLRGAVDGGAAMEREVVVEVLDGARARFALEARPRDGELVSTIFGVAAGVFEGTATPAVVKGSARFEGRPLPLTLRLAPLRQVVHLRFLPELQDSLGRFGLAAAAGLLEEKVAAGIEAIYDGLRLEVRLERPADFSPRGYAVIEIGGPDPNGLGLFGYDNTSSKDAGNLRLDDHIGGANAQTQADGSPGYGGVFVENFLYWSARPELPGGIPAGAPDPEPAFDAIFDGVRARPATLAELQGEGNPARVAEVSRALETLARLVADTAAHELGHSLGLAVAPEGPANEVHNPGDGPGCLMDAGTDRPFGERARLEGSTPSHLCEASAGYLREILGPPSQAPSRR